jgi:hypothetical protein
MQVNNNLNEMGRGIAAGVAVAASSVWMPSLLGHTG